MKKNKIIVSIIILIFIIMFIDVVCHEKSDDIPQLEAHSETIQHVKEETGMTAKDELYDVQVEYDGRKVLKIKPEIQYKIAFTGIIKKDTPKLEEIDNVFNNYYPNDKGIWIESNSREKFEKMLKENLNNQYEISDNGFLEIIKENNPTQLDISLKKMIESNRTYLITISGIYYEADIVTGEILDNFYEDMDPYQATKAVGEKDNIIIFLSTNSAKKLRSEEILQELTSYL